MTLTRKQRITAFRRSMRPSFLTSVYRTRSTVLVQAPFAEFSDIFQTTAASLSGEHPRTRLNKVAVRAIKRAARRLDGEPRVVWARGGKYAHYIFVKF